MASSSDRKSNNINDKDLVELAGYHAYKHQDIGRKIYINKVVYKVKDVKYNDPTGLDVITLKNLETGKYTIVYQGTDATKKTACRTFSPTHRWPAV
ncbi:hypothetical protein [Bacillus haynesii]|uniref:hypothetical protein n=1 Tax=Bacillus haynesii TaxID=1925021 RepID=UPI00227F981F|nr:hypothetical protein [Bacillus haynesii]MCY8342337.1 hypothetical protein [Bacillus haynesii]MCY9276417.1 hypothetical protein [Bacillus haynesii]MEC0754473.1 hypothetical protein [Bacillus haynesii]